MGFLSLGQFVNSNFFQQTRPSHEILQLRFSIYVYRFLLEAYVGYRKRSSTNNGIQGVIWQTGALSDS